MVHNQQPFGMFLIVAAIMVWANSEVGIADASYSHTAERALTDTQIDTAYKPHILLIVMDDLGSNDLGFHQTKIQTPNCDRLLYDQEYGPGIYLQNYYVLPSCSPTRTALLSGKYPLHTGVHHWIPVDSIAGMPLEDQTLADLLSSPDGGYETHAVGKWHVGYSRWEQTPTFRGFDSFFGLYTGSADYYSHIESGGYDMRYDRQRECGEGCSQVVDERGNYSTHVFTREAIRVIRDYKDRRDRRLRRTKEPSTHSDLNGESTSSASTTPGSSSPLFLYLAYQAVHSPDQVPWEYRKPYESVWPLNPKRQTYAGMLTAADEGIGNVTRALQDAGLWDDTLVIFTTDNGGPTTTCAVQGSSNYPKRGGKCSVWEGGTKGDGILSGPAMKMLGLDNHFSPSATVKLEGGYRQFPYLFHVVDWIPTIAEMIGVDLPSSATLDGTSQWLAMHSWRAARHEIFVGYTHNDASGEWYGPALRHQKWKLVQGASGGPDQYDGNPKGTPRRPQKGGMPGAVYLLFDLEMDPMELVNVANVYPDVVLDLIEKLKVYQQTYVPPQQDWDARCPRYPGPVETHLGPTLYVLFHSAVRGLSIDGNSWFLKAFFPFLLSPRPQDAMV
jgi:arylsulfatase A-like enzyme